MNIKTYEIQNCVDLAASLSNALLENYFSHSYRDILQDECAQKAFVEDYDEIHGILLSLKRFLHDARDAVEEIQE